MTLKDLPVDSSALIRSVGGEGALRQHFLDMGLLPGVPVTVVKYAPMGDPMELMLHGYKLTLRMADAEKVEIVALDEQPDEMDDSPTVYDEPHHPGFGEGGRFHAKGSGTPLPDGTLLTFALVGNQNSG
ncbi:MAG: ferrous iron transport protein A, partial [Clostridia bacterium]|nr:ferrous iron transport protein A [Clostridia bacterium]